MTYPFELVIPKGSLMPVKTIKSTDGTIDMFRKMKLFILEVLENVGMADLNKMTFENFCYHFVRAQERRAVLEKINEKGGTKSAPKL